MSVILDDALSTIMGSATLGELEMVIDRIGREFGFESSTYANMDRIPISGEPDPYYVTSLSHDFVRAYADYEFAGFDPIIRQASVTNAPFLWTQCDGYRQALRPHRGVKGKVRQLAELATDFGYSDGYVLPCHARDAHGRPRSGLLSLYWKGNPRDLLRPSTLPYWFRLVAQVYHERLLALREVDGDRALAVPVLTDRERECLVWACRGKTNGETADIIGVTERTVEFHIANAIKKLGVHNKVHCVAVAIQLGLVSP